MYPSHTNCTCGEEQPNFNDRECREYYWNRRRRPSGRHEDAIIEESSEHSSDEEREDEVRDKRHHRGSSVSENFRKEKSVSRSSSGIGTATLSSRGQRKVSSDDTSSRCFSPSQLSDAEKDLNDNYEDDDLADLPHTEKKKRMKQLGDNKFGSLKTLKKALSKKSLFKSRNKKKDESIEDYQEDNYPRKSPKESPKTPVLGKYSSKKMIEAVDDEFGSFTEDEEDTYSLSDYEEEEDTRHQNYEENYGRSDQLRRRSKSYGNVSQDQERFEVIKPPRRHKSGTEGGRNRHSSGPQGKYLKQYKGDILSSSEEDDSEAEAMTRAGEMVRMNGRKYSSQLREFSDYDEGKEEAMTDKPAINTLKKTFTAMLSRIGNSRMMGGTGDTSSDNISVNSRYSNALETRALADRPFTLMRRSGGGGGGLSRANSMASVGVRNNGKVVTDTGKKTFMYFSSDVGKGFIISDDEEVTGVISVMNMSRKKTKKIRDKITGTITDTLKRTNKRKKSKAAHDIPNFLFVNKPHFSSEESLTDGAMVTSSNCDVMVNGGGAFSRPSSRGPSPPPSPSPGSSRHRDKGKRYRGNVNSEEEDEDDNYGYSTNSRDQRKKSRSRHNSQHQHSNRDDYYEQHEPAKKQDRHRRKKTT